ncbi:hypothetical protein KIN20_026906 [Parelaphostrongylus tenuis]|uniref:Uncharacterized protein n=1 Tax=Parelaphostrongylus tenuis TaxID=148309 RepID=A0AAD5QYL1_PARTN|nr:hypothetical protein KIN20_026906 [Parelaphostrongylus tenuis]
MDLQVSQSPVANYKMFMLQMYLVELFANNSHLIPRCQELWKCTVNFETLTRYTLCCREALKGLNITKIFVYEKGKGWARDAWLTNSYWSPERDFMFHDMKEKNRLTFAKPQNSQRNLKPTVDHIPWFNTLSAPLDREQCRQGRMNWSHIPELIAPKEELEEHLNKRKKIVEDEYRTET